MGPILTVLKRILPSSGLVPETVSGTGQHVVHFAQGTPDLMWQPTDPDPELRASIRAWIAQTACPTSCPYWTLLFCRPTRSGNPLRSAAAGS